jgi:S-adenosylmethionine decarboxylase
MLDGQEWVVEAYGCDPAALRELAKLQALFEELIADLALHPVESPIWHQFPGPGGITGLALLAESHLACHTFPEHGTLCLNVFCCRPRKRWDFETRLQGLFRASSVVTRLIERAYHDH